VELEAILREPEARPLLGAAVLCHPHPVYGGTMDNRVVYRAGKAVMEAGLAALRFNFRGVGASTGSYDHGDGEKDDVSSAIDYLSGKYPGLPLVLVGFSFGAWVGLQAGCQDPRIQAMVGLGVPVSFYDFEFLTGNFKPTLFVIGTRDEYSPRDKMDGLARRMSSSFTLRWVEGASHFFVPGLDQLQSYVTEFLSHIEFFRSGDA